MSPERRRLSLGDALVLLGLLAQAAGLFYWAGETRQVLTDHERRIDRLEQRR